MAVEAASRTIQEEVSRTKSTKCEEDAMDSEKVFEIVLDKGLLALLILLAGAVFSRSLERLKSSLSWGAEVLKAKLALSRQVMTALRQLDDDHLQIAGFIAMAGELRQDIYEKFTASLKALEILTSECRLVFSTSTVDAIEAVRGEALNVLVTPRAGTITGSEASDESADSPDDLMRNLTPESRAQLKARTDAVSDAVVRAISQIRLEFPDLRGFEH
jgi:hypothetical protein